MCNISSASVDIALLLLLLPRSCAQATMTWSPDARPSAIDLLHKLGAAVWPEARSPDSVFCTGSAGTNSTRSSNSSSDGGGGGGGSSSGGGGGGSGGGSSSSGGGGGKFTSDYWPARKKGRMLSMDCQ